MSKVLRPSHWKWKAYHGTVNNYFDITNDSNNLTKKKSTVFVASKGQSDFVTPISFLSRRFYLFRKCGDDDKADLRVIDTECSSVVWKRKNGFVIPVSDFEFVILSSDDMQSKLEKIDIRTFKTTYECNLSGTLKDIARNNDSTVLDFCVSNNLTIHGLFYREDKRIQKITFDYSDGCKIKSSGYMKYKSKFIKNGMYKGLTLGPNGDSVRFCQFPKIIELK